LAWSRDRRVASDFPDKPTCVWHEVAIRLVHAFRDHKEWVAVGRMRTLDRVVVKRAAFFPDIDEELYELLNGHRSPMQILGEYELVEQDPVSEEVVVEEVVVTTLVENQEDVVDENVVDHDDVIPVVDVSDAPEKVFQSFVDHCAAKRMPKNFGSCGNMHKDIQRWGASSGEELVVGCTDDLYRSGSEFSKRYAVLAEERARKYVLNSENTESPNDPYEIGYCHLLFFDGYDTCDRMMKTIGPVLTPNNYRLVNTMRGVKFSDRSISYRYYGNRLHLSYLPGLPTIKAKVLWNALAEGFELTIQALDVIETARTACDEVSRTMDTFDRLFHDTLNMHDESADDSEDCSSISDVSSDDANDDHVRFVGRAPKKKNLDVFRTITLSGSWKSYVVEGFDVHENASFLRRFFTICKAYPAASIGSMILCDKGLAALEEYLRLEGPLRSQSCAKISRALRGLLNACLNEGAMWSYVFERVGVSAESVFVTH
jgi:hypothetical protein